MVGPGGEALVQAAGVVSLIAFLVGITVAMQSAAQLRQFGATVFVVDLVAVAITRELGPLMAAIVVAGSCAVCASARTTSVCDTPSRSSPVRSLNNTRRCHRSSSRTQRSTCAC